MVAAVATTSICVCVLYIHFDWGMLSMCLLGGVENSAAHGNAALC